MTRSVRALRRLSRLRDTFCVLTSLPVSSYEGYRRWIGYFVQLGLGAPELGRLDVDDVKKLIRLFNGHQRARRPDPAHEPTWATLDRSATSFWRTSL